MRSRTNVATLREAGAQAGLARAAEAFGSTGVGAVAAGAATFGAMAIGALAIRSIAIKRGKIGRLSIDELELGRLRVRELVLVPPLRRARDRTGDPGGQPGRRGRSVIPLGVIKDRYTARTDEPFVVFIIGMWLPLHKDPAAVERSLIWAGPAQIHHNVPAV